MVDNIRAGSRSRASSLGALALISVFLLLVGHAFVLPVASRPLVRHEGRELLAESDAAVAVGRVEAERLTIESSQPGADSDAGDKWETVDVHVRQELMSPSTGTNGCSWCTVQRGPQCQCVQGIIGGGGGGGAPPGHR